MDLNDIRAVMTLLAFVTFCLHHRVGRTAVVEEGVR